MSKKHKKGTEKKNSPLIGFAWYRREQWHRLLAISSDRDGLEDTYDEWLETAEKRVRELSRELGVIRKVDIDVEELLRWCNSQLRSVNGEVRSEFTSAKLLDLTRAGK